MKLVNQFNSCWGITLFRFFSWKLELWIVPAKTTVPQHRHPNIDSKLIPVVFGRAVVFEKNNSLSSRRLRLQWPYHFLRGFKITHNDWHSVENYCLWCPMIFLNIEKWLNKVKPSSASVDFELRKAA